ncbi:hypothetical protein PAHAL_6G144100 [Panicum hallii]|uniref:Uncharacterized protein n=1 Tax=Panicum hallii TaxID=206008 RepID=A0A2T8IG98_9POAL|nr:hypothetical protein PAHAL_6G144100 [Panicum hallii]
MDLAHSWFVSRSNPGHSTHHGLGSHPRPRWRGKHPRARRADGGSSARRTEAALRTREGAQQRRRRLGLPSVHLLRLPSLRLPLHRLGLQLCAIHYSGQ